MNNPKIGIVMSTYQRPDGKTPELLTRALNAIKNQSYNNWKLYLIGDKYSNQEEFDKISKIIPPDKILKLNLPVAVERNRYPEGGQKLWHSGGIHATNIGIEFSINEGYHWVCHCDHDELWHKDHLEYIAGAIQQTNAPFIYTKGYYLGTSQILPRNINSEELYINKRPIPSDTINSSCCINYFQIKLRRRDPNYFYNEHDAGDAAFLKRINILLDQNNLPSILVNKVTMTNDQEGYTKSVKKEDWK